MSTLQDSIPSQGMALSIERSKDGSEFNVPSLTYQYPIYFRAG